MRKERKKENVDSRSSIICVQKLEEPIRPV